MPEYKTSGIFKAEDVFSAGLARWAIYGENGAGKTHFLSTVPRDMQMVVLSADDENVKPLRGHSDHIIICKVTTWRDLSDQVLRLSQAKKTQIVAFDTLTRFQQLAINHILGNTGYDADSMVKYLNSPRKLPRGYDPWSDVGQMIDELVRIAVRLPMHVILLIQEQARSIKEAGGEEYTQVQPALTPVALRAVKDTQDLVGRLYVDEAETATGGGISLEGATVSRRDINPHRVDKRYLLVGKHPRYFAKGDSAALGYVVEEPTWEKLAAVLE